jgi:hypothetical protein
MRLPWVALSLQSFSAEVCHCCRCPRPSSAWTDFSTRRPCVNPREGGEDKVNGERNARPDPSKTEAEQGPGRTAASLRFI